jgi:hypothetical protein
MLHQARLVGRLEIREMNLLVDDNFHGGTWGISVFRLALKTVKRPWWFGAIV